MLPDLRVPAYICLRLTIKSHTANGWIWRWVGLDWEAERCNLRPHPTPAVKWESEKVAQLDLE